MAITITPLGLGGALKLINDADTDATVEANVTDGPATLYSVDIDNTANAAVTYVCLWNTSIEQGTGAVTIGTTAPDMILHVAASVRRVYDFIGGIYFSSGISIAAKTTAGTAGSTGPTSDVPVILVVE